MKTTKLRWLSMLLVLAMLVASFAACKSNENTDSGSDTTTGNQASSTTEPQGTTTEPNQTQGSTTEPPAVTTDPTMEDPSQTDPVTPPEDEEPVIESTFPASFAESDRYKLRNFSTINAEVAARIKVNGRSIETLQGIALDWSAASAEFRVDCKGDVKLTMNALSAAANVRFKVFVDGQESREITVLKETLQDYLVASNLAEGKHTIRLLRITMVEASNSSLETELTKITVNGVLLSRPVDKKYYIEFLGDSVTCGAGAKSASDQDSHADLSYAYKAAMALGADYSILSISGIGTLTGTNRHNERNLNIAVAQKYFSWYRDPTALFTPSRQADLVVIATNANDSGSPSATAFKEQIRTIIRQAQAQHGTDTKFIWVFDMYTTKTTPNQYVKEVFAEFGGEAAGFYTLNFFVDKTGGCSGHPIYTAHESYASILTNFIARKNILP